MEENYCVPNSPLTDIVFIMKELAVMGYQYYYQEVVHSTYIKDTFTIYISFKLSISLG